MGTDNYDDIIKQLKNVDTIDIFVTKSIEFFLKKTNDFNIICSLSETLYTQLAEFISHPDNPHIREILLLQHSKKCMRELFELIKQGTLDNIIKIINYIKHDLLIDTSEEVSNNVLETLERLYNSILELHHEFTRVTA